MLGTLIAAVRALLVAAFVAVLAPPAAVAAPPSWQELVRFSDAVPADKPGPAVKSWTPAEREAALTLFGWIVGHQPGLWQGITAQGPLTVYRLANQRSGAFGGEQSLFLADDAVVPFPEGQVRLTKPKSPAG